MSEMPIGSRVEAVWRDGRTRATGRVIARSTEPMILIETEDGEVVWWTSGLTRPAPSNAPIEG